MTIDMEAIRLGTPKKPPLQFKRGQLFLRGPISWKWISTAAKLPGKALHVAIAIWFLHFINKKPLTLRLSSKVLRGLGVTRFSGYRALEALEKARLVEVERRRGRNPMVKIISIDENTEDKPCL